MFHPVISDVEGLEISDAEKALFQKHRPFGFILFKRNCDNPAQVKALTDQMRDVVGNDNIPILIDQEGGRVARLGPPHWKKYPSAGTYLKLYKSSPDVAVKAVQVHALLISTDLLVVGVNVDCYPVADILYEGADKIIGDRAYGDEPEMVSILARAAAEAMLAAGVTPIIKHIPGHGRADVDSHLTLPVVNTTLDELRASDFIPFKNLSDLPCAMTAHVIYSDIDPERCATISPIINKEIIRGELGFKGILFSDDLSMKALNKTPAENAVDALNAGCDLALHCNGTLDERRDTLLVTNKLSNAEEARLFSILSKKRKPQEINKDKLYEWLMGTVKEYE